MKQSTEEVVLDKEAQKLLDYVNEAFTEEYIPGKKRYFTRGIILLHTLRHRYDQTYAVTRWTMFLENACKEYHKTHPDIHVKWYQHFSTDARKSVCRKLVRALESELYAKNWM